MNTLKSYFQEKLYVLEKDIQNCKESIVKSAADLNVESLKNLSEKLRRLKEEKSSFTTDLCRFCTVEEVIAVSEYKPRLYYDNIGVNLSESCVRYYYSYISSGVSVQEREMLVKKFGYSLNNIKVK